MTNEDKLSKRAAMILALADCATRGGLSPEQSADLLALRYAFAKAGDALLRHYEQIGPVQNGDHTLTPQEATRSDISKIIGGLFDYEPARHHI